MVDCIAGTSLPAMPSVRHRDANPATNLVREDRDDNPFSWYRWQYESVGRLLVQDGTLPGQEQWRWDAAGKPLEGSAEKVTHNRLTQLNGIRWHNNIHARTVEKDNGQTRGTATNRRRR
ncbi:TPA: hypothetical protein QCH54_004951 [Enterobacter ludwigii]|nr:hypothetical protein [Enterobacter ludwigii]HDR2280854.1 hypothetical protein [Enterobacter ludwigii]